MQRFVAFLLILLFPTFTALSIELSWLTANNQSGRFVQEKHIKALSRPFVTKGQYHYSQDSGLRWHTLQPVDNQLLINKQGVSEIESDGSTKLITSDVSFSQLLLSIFSADKTLLTQQFTMQETPSGLSLSPLNPKIQSIIKQINLTVVAKELQQIELDEVSGNLTVISLTPSPIPPVVD
ncbi:outer membrane lipoprotein carrier protein LolA [Paraglaciecola aquimarina]|uniref:Outer membrane lipoprotein carrier protein LolA n=1 Tax=Paraglaciecola aquimarina TaxID=1235557 RepID=A0ABU3SSP1_9ALTE|nr:outer membrane lipoprotein carrier protein LolA [Paraglaciecola aquimarina]MDU0353030.1 outer membrane lipoprotein carrier protein LolA [Paraglaciecola aquimarina]